jgi:hypothetical protein
MIFLPTWNHFPLHISTFFDTLYGKENVMIVMKFGGSSVANAERVRHVAEIVKSQIARKPVLVLSAMGDTTDILLEAGDAAYQKMSIYAMWQQNPCLAQRHTIPPCQNALIIYLGGLSEAKNGARGRHFCLGHPAPQLFRRSGKGHYLTIR